MPIQTIDHYLVAPRSQEASQVRQQDTARGLQEQSVLQVQSDREGRQQAERTRQLGETENKEERYDAKEKGKNSYEGRQQKRRRKDEEKSEKHVGEGGSRFDIKI